MKITAVGAGGSGAATVIDTWAEVALIPAVSKAPGFVAGHWTIKDNTGLSMLVFESEDAATEASQMVRTILPDAVSLEDVEVREVVGHA